MPFEKNIVHRRFRYPLKHLSDFKLFLVCRLSLAYFQSNKLLSIDYGWNLDTYHEFVKKCKRHYWWRITFWSCKSVSMLELWSRTVSTIYLGKASWTGMACLWRMMRIRPGGTVSKLVGTIISRKLHFIHTINIYASKKSNLKAHKEWTIILQCKFIKAQNSFRLNDIFKELWDRLSAKFGWGKPQLSPYVPTGLEMRCEKKEFHWRRFFAAWIDPHL